MFTHANEVTVAEIESRVGARTTPENVPNDTREGESLNLRFSEHQVRETARVEPEFGMAAILKLVRAELSAVIEQGKAALMKPERVGFHQPGFDGVALTSLVDAVNATMLLCEYMVFQPDIDPRQRMAAAAFSGLLEKFQYNFFGLETESVGRSDMRGLLPGLQEFKQICMEIELKLLLKEEFESEVAHHAA